MKEAHVGHMFVCVYVDVLFFQTPSDSDQLSPKDSEGSQGCGDL